MKLTPQDKLALALTSAGSMRNLAALVGVTHQKIGRWLREGQDGGVKAIPKEAHAAIDQAFRMHAQVAHEQARVDGIPYLKGWPVYAERKLLRTGQKGDRVFVEHTQFIRREVRTNVMGGMQQSKKMLAASVRSRVDIHRYAKTAATEELARRKAAGGRPGITVGELTKRIQAGIENKHMREIKAVPVLRELFTRYENIMPATAADQGQAVRSIENKLRQKHEPATGGEGTQLADQYLFQLLPQRRNTSEQSKPRSSSRRHIRGRGPK